MHLGEKETTRGGLSPSKIRPMPDLHTPSTRINTIARWATIICGSALALTGGAAFGGLPIPTEAADALLIFLALCILAEAISFITFAVTEAIRPQDPVEVLERRHKVNPVPGAKLPLLFITLTLALAVFYTAHVFMWNPLVARPGLELDEIYRQLKEAGEFSQRVVVFQGLVSAIPLAVLVPLHMRLRKNIAYSPARAVGLCSAAATLSLTNLWFGWGWYMAMGIADTFGIGGGDYAPTRIFMPLALMVLFLSALYFTFKPIRSHRPQQWEEETAL